MGRITDYPALVGVFSFVALSFSTWIGATVFRKRWPLRQGSREDFGVILPATLTLLGLLLGFSFSMAANRYDQRKNFEEQEANAIGTEYVRADLLPPADAAKVRELLKNYLDQRITAYLAHNDREVRQIDEQVAQSQSALWAAVLGPGRAQPTSTVALVVTGMNEVIDAQGYARAALWNRIPTGAWALLAVIAVLCSVLIGYSEHTIAPKSVLLLILPFVVSVSLFLIADIDTPRGGVIRVFPHDLTALAESLRAP